MNQSAIYMPSGGAQQRRSAWLSHLSGLGVLTALMVFYNFEIVSSAVQVWQVSPTFSHCFLIIPVSAYLVWQRRDILKTLTPHAYPKGLLLALPLLAILLLGTIVGINEARQLAFVGLFQILILSLLGPTIYRAIRFPALFLFFLVPMGEYLVAPMQHFTTLFISVGLTLLGILHHTEINTIDLVNGRFEVAEACAGLRFFIATVAIGVLFVHLMYRKWYKMIIYLLASVIVPFIANGFRALGIVLIAHLTDNKVATGADHIVYGWGFLVVILGGLMFVGSRFADDPAQENNAQPASNPDRTRLRVFPAVAVCAALLLSAVPLYVYAAEQGAAKIGAISPLHLPPGWSTTVVSQDWHPDYASPDAQLSVGLQPSAGSAPVDAYLNYYAVDRKNHTLISSTNKLWDETQWQPASQGTVTINISGKPVQFGQLVLSSGAQSRIVWWTYWVGGRFTTSATEVKLERLKVFLGKQERSALVAYSTVVSLDEVEAAARLRAAVRASQCLDEQLRSVDPQPAGQE